MDRVLAMLILLGVLVSLVLMLLALFTVAPIFTSCLLSLVYTLYWFFTNEENSIHHAQEFENRFWTIFALLFSTALFFANDSPIAFGRWSVSLGILGVLVSGYAMHTWDRYLHRVAISRQVSLRRSGTANSSLIRLQDLGIPVEEQLAKITDSLAAIDQLLIPSTINNFINIRFVLRKEREIISIFEECDARALNYLIGHVKLGLLFYKIKDHRNFSGQHRTELIQLLAVDRLPALTVMSRVIVLHALQLMRLRASARAELWVRNVILNTHQDDLSELKTLTDAKGDYFSMNKLIYDDIVSESVRQDILTHIRKEAAVQQAHLQMGSRRAKRRLGHQSWRKVLSDVDDTLCSSGGSYPAGIDKRYMKKVVYPGVLSFYRELDLGTQGPEEWPEHRIGNLVFLSARPHVYKDMSEKVNFAKFEKLRLLTSGDRKGMHTVPSLLAGDIASGRDYIVTNDMEPLALKKFDNFKRYVSIYPEYRHVFICDNGQGDVRAGEMMFDAFPYEFEGLFVHVVQDVTKTHGYFPERWREKGLKPCFFRTYPEAALQAVTRDPPMMRVKGLRRVCQDTVKDFSHIASKQWVSSRQKSERRAELNQALWRANQFLAGVGEMSVPLIEAEREWQNGEHVRTPYGIARVKSFDSTFDLYEVELDWRPLTIQVAEYKASEKPKPSSPARSQANDSQSIAALALETVVEESEDERSETSGSLRRYNRSSTLPIPSLVGDGEVDEQNVGDDDRSTESAEPIMSSGEATGEQPYVPVRRARSSMSDEGSAPLERSFGELLKADVPADQLQFRARAKIRGRDIFKYTPPTLPRLDKKASKFSFWTAEAQSKIPVFKPGDRVLTPYGPAIVDRHRVKDGVIIIDIEGWKARAYLQESEVKPAHKATIGLLHSLRRSFTAGESSPKPPSLDFPYAKGTVIKTPYGEGTVKRPIPAVNPPSKSGSITVSRTLGISLTSWMLADQTHPTLYCTVETAREWKDTRSTSQKGDGILFALGSSMSKLLGRGHAIQPEKKPDENAVQLFKQYYRDGAAVTTLFGSGTVNRFRETDGFYEVALIEWPLANNMHPLAILRKEQIKSRIAKGCHEGYPVLTSLGVSGMLASVGPTTGIHIVTVGSCGMVCYLQPKDVICPLKAAVGQDVLTAYGDGKVIEYRLSDDIYVIRLHGWGATLYAKAETFDRDEEGMQDRDGPFGMKWLLGYLFSSSAASLSGDGKAGSQNRSRSNSVTSFASSRKSVSGT